MDERYMERALKLAEKGAGFTSPNPLVGAVIVKEDRIIGQGYHQVFGGPHAEINAFEDATEDVRGATMYVTLEPCSHHGKTPPCVDAIIRNGIRRVVIGMVDPNPLVAGKGVGILREKGIDVITGVLEEKCKAQNEIFIKYITTKGPFCIFKSAMTLDGKISTATGDSKWVSGKQSREYVHRLRNRVSAILVGVGTVIADDPMLTTRLEGVKTSNPVRIIVDTRGRIPMESKIVNTSGEVPTILATTELASADALVALEAKGIDIMVVPVKEGRVDIAHVVARLGEMGIDSILVEGGGAIGYSFLEERLIDKVLFFIAPKLVGGDDSKSPLGGRGIQLMKDAVELSDVKTSPIGEDILVSGYPKWR